MATERAPLHWLAVIFVGGCLGTATRAALESAFVAAPGGWPVTLWINLGGSLALGALLEALARSGPDQGWRRTTRLGVGTGVLGGFTTYSSFAVETIALAGGSWVSGVGYALASVLLGVVAASVGIQLTRAALRARPRAADAG